MPQDGEAGSGTGLSWWICRVAWLLVIFFAIPAQAEQGVLVVHVEDVERRPLAGVVLATKGNGSTGPATDVAGKTRIRLAPATRVGSRVTLQIVSAPRDYVFISPWGGTTHVPAFENDADNCVSIVLAERQVARVFDLPPGEVEEVLRALDERTEDPYYRGLAAFYQKRYAAASNLLERSFGERKVAAANARQWARDAAFFLGRALDEEGKYRESAKAYREALGYMPGDAAVMNNLGVSLYRARDYSAAEPLLRGALAIRKEALGSEHRDVAGSLNNLAALLRAKRDYAEAEPLYRRALAIRRKS